MGQSESQYLESDGNLENDQIIQPQNPPEMLLINDVTLQISDNNQTLSDILSSKTESQNIKHNNELSLSDSMIKIKKQNDTALETKQEEKNEINMSEYAVNYNHINIPIAEFADSMETNDTHSGFKLSNILEQMNIQTSDYTMWQVGTKVNAKSRLNSVIEFAEKNANCSKDVKIKLRIITKLIMDSKNKNDYKYILLLIASHGHVCNVMKEVAINNAYHTMTNNLSEYIQSQSLKQQILKVLYDFRVLLVEKLFHSFQFHNNTHYIAGFHNQIAKQIGVKPYNDPNICYPTSSKYPNWKHNLDKRYLKTMYTKENILQWIVTQINEKKIGYQKIVECFEQNCPNNMKTNKFLEMVIDINSGKINENYLCWLLYKLDIFVIKDNEWKDIEACWDGVSEISTGETQKKKKKKRKRKRTKRGKKKNKQNA